MALAQQPTLVTLKLALHSSVLFGLDYLSNTEALNDATTKQQFRFNPMSVKVTQVRITCSPNSRGRIAIVCVPLFFTSDDVNDIQTTLVTLSLDPLLTKERKYATKTYHAHKFTSFKVRPSTRYAPWALPRGDCTLHVVALDEGTVAVDLKVSIEAIVHPKRLMDVLGMTMMAKTTTTTADEEDEEEEEEEVATRPSLTSRRPFADSLAILLDELDLPTPSFFSTTSLTKEEGGGGNNNGKTTAPWVI